MKMMKGIACAFLATTMLLGGCSSGNTPTPTATAVSTAVSSTGTLDAVVQSYSGQILTVKATNGVTYEFSVPDPAVFVTTEALNVGDTVEITYNGALNGEDTTGTTVTKVEDKTTEETVTNTIVGTVVDASMNSITIDANAVELTFSTTDAQMITTNGIMIGNTVYIDYVGTINGTDTSNVVVHTVVDNDDNKTAPINVPTPTPIATATPTPAPTLVPVASIVVNSANDWKYALQDANIYAGNSSKYKKVSYLYAQQAISVTGYTNDGWARVDQNGTVGFVPANVLTPNAPATPTPKPTATPTPTPVPVVKHHLYISYITEEGDVVNKSYDGLFKEGEYYSIPSPAALLGATPDQDPVTGTMGTGDQYITVTYYQQGNPDIYTSNTGPAN